MLQCDGPCSCILAHLLSDTCTPPSRTRRQHHKARPREQSVSVSAAPVNPYTLYIPTTLLEGARHVRYPGHLEARWIAEGNRRRPETSAASGLGVGVGQKHLDTTECARVHVHTPSDGGSGSVPRPASPSPAAARHSLEDRLPASWRKLPQPRKRLEALQQRQQRKHSQQHQQLRAGPGQPPRGQPGQLTRGSSSSANSKPGAKTRPKTKEQHSYSCSSLKERKHKEPRLRRASRSTVIVKVSTTSAQKEPQPPSRTPSKRSCNTWKAVPAPKKSGNTLQVPAKSPLVSVSLPAKKSDGCESRSFVRSKTKLPSVAGKAQRCSRGLGGGGTAVRPSASASRQPARKPRVLQAPETAAKRSKSLHEAPICRSRSRNEVLRRSSSCRAGAAAGAGAGATLSSTATECSSPSRSRVARSPYLNAARACRSTTCSAPTGASPAAQSNPHGRVVRSPYFSRVRAHAPPGAGAAQPGSALDGRTPTLAANRKRKRKRSSSGMMKSSRPPSSAAPPRRRSSQGMPGHGAGSRPRQMTSPQALHRGTNGQRQPQPKPQRHLKKQTSSSRTSEHVTLPTDDGIPSSGPPYKCRGVLRKDSKLRHTQNRPRPRRSLGAGAGAGTGAGTGLGQDAEQQPRAAKRARETSGSTSGRAAVQGVRSNLYSAPWSQSAPRRPSLGALAQVQVEVTQELLRPESIRHMSDKCLAGALAPSKKGSPTRRSERPSMAPSPSQVSKVSSTKWYGPAPGAGTSKRREGLPTPDVVEPTALGPPAPASVAAFFSQSRTNVVAGQAGPRRGSAALDRRQIAAAADAASRRKSYSKLPAAPAHPRQRPRSTVAVPPSSTSTRRGGPTPGLTGSSHLRQRPSLRCSSGPSGCRPAPAPAVRVRETVSRHPRPQPRPPPRVGTLPEPRSASRPKTSVFPVQRATSRTSAPSHTPAPASATPARASRRAVGAAAPGLAARLRAAKTASNATATTQRSSKAQLQPRFQSLTQAQSNTKHGLPQGKARKRKRCPSATNVGSKGSAQLVQRRQSSHSVRLGLGPLTGVGAGAAGVSRAASASASVSRHQQQQRGRARDVVRSRSTRSLRHADKITTRETKVKQTPVLKKCFSRELSRYSGRSSRITLSKSSSLATPSGLPGERKRRGSITPTVQCAAQRAARARALASDSNARSRSLALDGKQICPTVMVSSQNGSSTQNRKGASVYGVDNIRRLINAAFKRGDSIPRRNRVEHQIPAAQYFRGNERAANAKATGRKKISRRKDSKEQDCAAKRARQNIRIAKSTSNSGNHCRYR